jgi:hypothetical protein
MNDERKIEIEELSEVDAVEAPPKARVDAVDRDVRAQARLSRRLPAQKPQPAAPAGEPGGDLYEAVVEALKEIYDPEIPVNIYDLGLIYGVDIADDGHAW